MDTPELEQSLATPDGKELAAALRKLGIQPCTVQGMEHLSWSDAIGLALYAKAARGDVQAAKLITDMVNSKSAEPVQKVTLHRHFLDYAKDDSDNPDNE